MYLENRNSLALANEYTLKTIAFPAISCGVYGYPTLDAAKVRYWHLSMEWNIVYWCSQYLGYCSRLTVCCVALIQVSLAAVQNYIGNLQEVHFLFFDKQAMNDFVDMAEMVFAPKSKHGTGENCSINVADSNVAMDDLEKLSKPVLENLLDAPIEKMVVSQSDGPCTSENSKEKTMARSDSLGVSIELRKINQESILNPSASLSKELDCHEDTNGSDLEAPRHQGQKRKKPDDALPALLGNRSELHESCVDVLEPEKQTAAASPDSFAYQNSGEKDISDSKDCENEEAKRKKRTCCSMMNTIMAYLCGHSHHE